MLFNNSPFELCVTALAAICLSLSVTGADKPVSAMPPHKPVLTHIPMKLNRTQTLRRSENKRKRPKIGPKLTQALASVKEQGADSGLQLMQNAGSVPDDNSARVSAIVRATSRQNLEVLRHALAARGIEVVRTGSEALKINASLDTFEQTAAMPEVRSVRALQPPRKKAFTGEGVAATFADAWQGFGFTGEGTKVAVVDTGFMSLNTLVSAGEIPADYVPVNFSADPNISDTDEHGSACAEIVHDIAPGAELHLIKIDDITDLVPVALYCASAGIDIISCSLGFDVINFHDGIAYDNWYTGIADHPVTAVNLANDAGILFAVAAGNEQQQHTLISWGDSGDYLIWGDSDGEEDDLNLLYSDYGATEFPVGQTIYVMMTWNRWPYTDEDYDLNLYYYNETRSAWELVAFSDEWQNGSADSYPVEEIYYTTRRSGSYAVDVVRYSSATAPTFLLRYYGIPYPYYWEYNNYLIPAPGSLSIPGDTAAAFTVGAIDFGNYPGGPVDYYSSFGPNNRAFTGGSAAVKPDLCAPAGITSAAYGDSFSGTSAATPHAAGVAALVKGVYPYFSVDELKAYLEKYGFDIAPAGKDNINGSGAAQLPASLAVIEGEALKATAVAQSGGSALIQFTGIPGEQYTVMARDALTSGSWQIIGAATVATDGTATFADPGPLPPARFYKLVKP